MVRGQNYEMTFKYNNKDLEIDNMVFGGLYIYEILHLGIYYVELKLLNTVASFRDYPLITGMKFSISATLHTNEIIDLDLIIYDKEELNDYTSIILMPEIYVTELGRNKYSIGYNDKIDNIVKTIATDVGITLTDIEKTSLEKKLYLQLNQTYFNFIKSNLKYAKNNKSNFIFFIDKFNKLKFYSVGYLKNKKEVIQVYDKYVNNLTIKDISFSTQISSGFGGTAHYFDWDSGEFKNITYGETNFTGVGSSDKISDKIGINKTYVSEDNTILMLNPIAQDLYPIEQYNEIELENEVLRKNYFNIFVSFNMPGLLSCSPAEIADTYFTASQGLAENKIYSGKWVIYSVVHNFLINGYFMKVTISNSSINGLIDTNFI